MRIFGIILLLAFAADLFPDDAERDGRRGNELYADEAYDEAAEAFASGLAVLRDDAEARLRYGLHNNLGAALLKSGDGEGARQAFDRALRTAPTDEDLARTHYNAGNAAMTVRDLEAALDHYRHSLLRDPESEDAKFNYEYARRQLERQQQQQQDQGDSDESDDEQQQEDPQDSGERGEDGDGEPQDQNPQDGSSEQEPQGGEQQGQDEPQREAGAEPSTERVSEAEAERILQALQNEEQQLLRQVQRLTGRPRPVEKDW